MEAVHVYMHAHMYGGGMCVTSVFPQKSKVGMECSS